MLEESGREDKTSDKSLSVSSKLLAQAEKFVVPGAVTSPTQETGSKWNTTNLGLRLGADAASAATASVLVAPVICVIDQSIIAKAATGQSIWTCLAQRARPALLSPQTFLASRAFFLIFGLYFSTYVTANTIDTATSTIFNKPASTVTASFDKFVATSAVNMTACVYKDSQFVKMLVHATSPKVPVSSFTLFAIRDSMTIFASFNLPPVLAPRLQSLPEPVKQRFSRILSTEGARSNTAQFIAPAAMQLLSTPIHLLGLDLYNRKGKIGPAERVTRVVRDWGASALARMGRIIPAFGVGGVVNAKMRRTLMGKLQE